MRDGVGLLSDQLPSLLPKRAGSVDAKCPTWLDKPPLALRAVESVSEVTLAAVLVAAQARLPRVRAAEVAAFDSHLAAFLVRPTLPGKKDLSRPAFDQSLSSAGLLDRWQDSRLVVD